MYSRFLKESPYIHYSRKVTHKDSLDIHDSRTDSLMGLLYMNKSLKDYLTDSLYVY